MRILLVDDEPRITRAWARILERDRHEVISFNTPLAARSWLGSATDRDAIHLALVDLVMDGGNGLDLLSEILARFPKTLAVLVTAHPSAEVLIDAQKRGALVATKPLGARALRQLVCLAVHSPGKWGRVVARRLPNLSPREAQVVTGRMEGLANKEIADRLDIAPGTVDTFWRRIYHKTGLGTQPEIVSFIAEGFLDGQLDGQNDPR